MIVNFSNVNLMNFDDCCDDFQEMTEEQLNEEFHKRTD